MKSYKEMMNEGVFQGTDIPKHGYVANVVKDIKDGEEIEVVVGEKIHSVKFKYTDDIKQLQSFVKDMNHDGVKSVLKSGTKYDTIFIGNDGKNYKWSQINKIPYSIGKGKLDAADWEQVISVAYNMLSHGITEEAAVKKAKPAKWEEKHINHLEVGKDVVKNSYSKTSGTMVHFGSASSSLTSKWDQYFISATGKSAPMPTKTPKTDMYKGSDHISLKKAGGSQLMSGGKAETLATIAFAYDQLSNSEKSKAFDKSFKLLAKDVTEKFTVISADKTITAIKADIAKGDKSDLSKLVTDQLIKNTVMQNTLRDLIENTKFKKMIIQEATTGNNKFSDKLSKATQVLIFDIAGNSKLYNIDSSLISTYAKKTNFQINFKSSGRSKSVSMRVGLNASHNNIDISKMLQESMNEVPVEQYSLREGIIEIGKGAIAAVKKYLMKVLTKFISKLKKIFIGSLDAVLNFLGIKMSANSPDIVWKI